MTIRVGLQGWGSEGDLRPLIALAARLRRNGHEVRLVLTPVDGKDYRPLCESLGVPLRVVPERLAITLQQLVAAAESADPTKLITAVLDLTFSPYVEVLWRSAINRGSFSPTRVFPPSVTPSPTWSSPIGSISTRPVPPSGHPAATGMMSTASAAHPARRRGAPRQSAGDRPDESERRRSPRRRPVPSPLGAPSPPRSPLLHGGAPRWRGDDAHGPAGGQTCGVVLPFILEQRMWAKRVEQVGGGIWRSFWKATPERVGSMIRQVAESAPIREHASAMAKAMQGEDGTGTATTRIESLVSGNVAPWRSG